MWSEKWTWTERKFSAPVDELLALDLPHAPDADGAEQFPIMGDEAGFGRGWQGHCPALPCGPRRGLDSGGIQSRQVTFPSINLLFDDIL
jgi:hypothetical protein